jgi:hypothetical protein
VFGFGFGDGLVWTAVIVSGKRRLTVHASISHLCMIFIHNGQSHVEAERFDKLGSSFDTSIR